MLPKAVYRGVRKNLRAFKKIVFLNFSSPERKLANKSSFNSLRKVTNQPETTTSHNSDLKKTSDNNARVALINHAMKVYRSKRYIIDELPKEQREKLMFMALKTFGENKKSPKSE